jgi:hypothetical protein
MVIHCRSYAGMVPVRGRWRCPAKAVLPARAIDRDSRVVSPHKDAMERRGFPAYVLAESNARSGICPRFDRRLEGMDFYLACQTILFILRETDFPAFFFQDVPARAGRDVCFFFPDGGGP